MGFMEIVRSTEYREDNQQVVMYIRDINDDYLKLLQIAMCHTLILWELCQLIFLRVFVFPLLAGEMN